MNNIITRYFFKRFIVPVFVSLFVLTGIFLLDRLFLLIDLLIRKATPFYAVFDILVSSLPFVLSMTIPLAFLAGSLMGFGSLAENKEIEALRSGGVLILRPFFPVLMFAIGIGGFLVYFNGRVLPDANHRVRSLITDISRKKPTARIEPGVFNEDFKGYTIFIGKRNEMDNTIEDIIIYDKTKRKPTTIYASNGRLGFKNGYYTFVLYNSEIHELMPDGSYRVIKADTHKLNFKVDDKLVLRERRGRSLREMRYSTLKNEIYKLNKRIDTLLKRRPIPEKEINALKKQRMKYLAVLYKMFSLPVGGIIFLIFGASLGIRLKKGSIGISMILSLLFFSLYYILLLAGEKYGIDGSIDPAIGIWIPNIIFFFPMAYLFISSFLGIKIRIKR